jgi:HSP20 family protein
MASLMNPVPRSLFDEFFRDLSPGYFIKPLHGDPLPAQIKVDVKEGRDAFTVLAEIPGVSRDDIHVGVEGGVITISTEVKQHDQTREDKVLRSERYYGSVARSFQLPSEVDPAGCKAKYENGVLTLTLPKRAASSTKRVTVD